jgi:hypothetical protein
MSKVRIVEIEHALYTEYEVQRYIFLRGWLTCKSFRTLTKAEEYAKEYIKRQKDSSRYPSQKVIKEYDI